MLRQLAFSQSVLVLFGKSTNIDQVKLGLARARSSARFLTGILKR